MTAWCPRCTPSNIPIARCSGPGGGSAYYLYFNGGYAVTYYEDYVLYAMVVRSGQ